MTEMLSSAERKKLSAVDIIVYLLLIVFVLIFVWLGIGRHEALKSFQNDIGVYSQLLWNTSHNHWFEVSGALLAVTLQPDGTTLQHFNYLSAHFSPILLLLVPFYALWSDPKLLIIVQAFAVGSGALPVYWLSRAKLGQWAGLVFVGSYMLYPLLHNALLYDFHEVVLAVPIVSFALWFWYRQRTGWLLVLLGLLMLVQEHTSLIVMMFGLYIAFFQKRWRFGLIIAGLACLFFITVMTILIPTFSTTGQSTLLQASFFPTRYQWLGSSIGEVISTVAHEPVMVLQNLFGLRRIGFLLTLLIPLFGLPLFSGLFLLSLPVLVIYFLSQFWLTYSINFYHSAILAPIIYFAAIFSFTRLIRELKWRRIFLVLIIIASFITSVLYSVTPLSGRYRLSDYQPSDNAQRIKEIKSIIPADAALVVQHNLGPHFANRRALFHFPFMLDQAEYAVVDVYNPYVDNPDSFFSFTDVTEVGTELWRDGIISLLEDERWGVIYSRDGWLVFQRGASRDLNQQAQSDFATAWEKLRQSL